MGAEIRWDGPCRGLRNCGSEQIEEISSQTTLSAQERPRSPPKTHSNVVNCLLISSSEFINSGSFSFLSVLSSIDTLSVFWLLERLRSIPLWMRP